MKCIVGYYYWFITVVLYGYVPKEKKWTENRIKLAYIHKEMNFFILHSFYTTNTSRSCV